MRIAQWVTSLCIVAVGSLATAATITFKEGASPDGSYNAAFDHLRNNQAGPSPSTTTNNVGSTGVPNGDSNRLRQAVQFDISAIPAGSIIKSVTYKAWARQNDPNSVSTDRVVEIHELLTTIVEDESWWGESSSGNPWTPGGDFDSTVLTSLSLNPNTWVDDSLYADANDPAVQSSYSFPSTPGLVAVAQSALDGSGLFRILLKTPEEVENGSERAIFPFAHDNIVAIPAGGTNRGTFAEQFPELIINYTVPEPTSIVLLVLAVGCCVASRRITRKT